MTPMSLALLNHNSLMMVYKCVLHTQLKNGFWGSNSNPYAYALSTLLTEPSPSSPNILLFLPPDLLKPLILTESPCAMDLLSLWETHSLPRTLTSLLSVVKMGTA